MVKMLSVFLISSRTNTPLKPIQFADKNLQLNTSKPAIYKLGGSEEKSTYYDTQQYTQP